MRGISRRAVLGIISLTLGVVVGLILGEVACRIVAPDWLERRMSLLRLGISPDEMGTDLDWPAEFEDGQFVRFRPGSTFRVVTGEYETTAHVDQFGGRTTCVESPQLPEQKLVLLGDSFTFGVGVEDCESFASLIASDYPDLRTVNLGVPGSALPHQIWIALKRRQAAPVETAYVYFFFLGNDFDDIVNAQLFWWESQALSDADRVRPLREARKSRAVLEWLNQVSHREPLSRSYSFQLARAAALRIVLGRRATIVDPVFKAMSAGDPKYQADVRAALRKSLGYLKSTSDRAPDSVLLVAIPDRYQLLDSARELQAEYYGLDSRTLDPELPNRVLAEEAERAGISILDPMRCLDERADKESFYYIQDNHFTRIGHSAFRDCISEGLDEFMAK